MDIVTLTAFEDELEKISGLKRAQRIGQAAFKKLRSMGQTHGLTGTGLDEAGARAGAKLSRRMEKAPGGAMGYVKHLGVDPHSPTAGTDFMRAKTPGKGFGQ